VNAFSRNLEIIGETGGYIPLEIHEQHSDLTRLEIRGTRNIVAHACFGISLLIILVRDRTGSNPLADGLIKLPQRWFYDWLFIPEIKNCMKRRFFVYFLFKRTIGFLSCLMEDTLPLKS
jgi:hypothetical protein